MYCFRCGTHMEPSQSFCPACGAPASQGAIPGASVGQSAVPGANPPSQDLVLLFVEDGSVVAQHTVQTGGNETITFGSAPSNDLVVAPPSRTVSGHHGTIEVRGGWCTLHDNGSLNGLYLNGTKAGTFRVAAGDVVSIGKPEPGARRCVLVVGDAGMARSMFPLRGAQSVTVGRVGGNDLVLNDPTVSAHHAQLQRSGSAWYVSDLQSTNGTRVDGSYALPGQPHALFSGSVVSFGNTQTVFLDDCLLVVTERHGVDVVAQNLVRYRKNGRTTRITTNHVSLHIKRGDFVAIVGGSGCGKSTLLNELSGGEPADEGSVFVNGVDLYANYEMLKTSIGFVPQQDIVYDNLTLEDMLASAAKLRMQPDTTREEREQRIQQVVDLLELGGVRKNLIGNLSGGQKKRASIAVELMADPRLLFLDEPTSGLDPGIERKLMQTLANMAHEGRTIILVTHTTLNLHLCDQVVFLGGGGKLCWAGQPAEALRFFGVGDFVDVYGIIDEDGEGWETRFSQWRAQQRTQAPQVGGTAGEPLAGRRTPPFARQLAVLSGRYAKLLLNDRSRMLLLLLQAPLLAALISFVAGSACFKVFEDTKSCLFALSCAAFWVGILDSIQEICKEREILGRDYEGGVRLGAYLWSKVLVLGTLCLVQSAALSAVFCNLTGLPQSPLFNGPAELFLTLFLTTLAAMSLGLLVSALFKNPDRAIAMAPLLIMPQILFSGLVFELTGATEGISYAVTCRWAMEALGTTANLNDLDLKLYGEHITVPQSEEELHDQTIEVPATTVTVSTGFGEQEVEVPAEERTFDTLNVTVPEMEKVIDGSMFEHEPDSMFEHSMGHLVRSWAVLAGSSALCVVGCLGLLKWGLRKH